MGVVKFGVKDAVGHEELGGGNFYDVEKLGLPPVGPYRGVLKRLELKKSGPASKVPGTPMLGYLVEIKEPKGSKKAKYNGYGIFGNQMITDQGKGYLNLMLNSIAGSPEKGLKLQRLFWEKGVTTEKDGEGHIKKIGTFNVGSPDCEIDVIFGTKNKKTNTQYPEPGLEITKFMVAAESGDDDDDEGVDDDDDDADFSDDDDADGDGDESDEGVDDEDDDDLGDDGDDDDLGDEGAEGDDEGVDEELKAELAELDLKALRLRARDEFGIAAPETKGKTPEEITQMILEVSKSRYEDDDDLDGEEEEPVKPVRKKKANAPF